MRFCKELYSAFPSIKHSRHRSLLKCPTENQKVMEVGIKFLKLTGALCQYASFIRAFQQVNKIDIVTFLISLLITLFLALHSGTVLVYPFITLQALEIGLTFTDLGIIGIFQPILTLVGTTLIGIAYVSRRHEKYQKFIFIMHTAGMVGDKWGMRPAFLLTMLCMSAGTWFHFVPRYVKVDRIPLAIINSDQGRLLLVTIFKLAIKVEY